MYETEYKRKFLVVIDETPECDRALTFAAYRVKRTGGVVVLMSVVQKPEFIGLGVEDVLRAEAVEEAERNLDARLARIRDIGDVKVESVIREGEGPEQIETVIGQDREIAILVLAASTSTDGPGPLVMHFAGRANALPIPLTVVPGRMSDEEIIAIC
ncbi:Universal stress protein UspA-related nucleotide-binding protein [Devosia sp. LC5]|uniref:universal stress protein n=1 Tax=Devosia sp. LC5 TaxID=1502724 RepID=UPI0004E395A5|nr:universal stress protein [Devosia sp. LC5]KFC68731.1 Universal stress protein UspA-related nucleotide-binding protein [Devosia sp. LC5]